MLLIVESGQSFSRDDATNQIAQCLNYIIGQGGDAPPSECCNGVRALVSSVPTTPDRRDVCECLKGAVAAFPTIKDDLGNSLFKKYGVSVEFSISKDINCQT
ncbi:hypothetical protein TanjilG_09181 [Lupinus angustifolius]|uniref:Non-specific lipid-transfer protein n=1 Tax=Lupinus angustifolius TaxID=3871 RepID=A0A394DGG9_LUPAN|nr:PREDICTED: non-specific lipid-transfer protein A-like [Lupinus angustifolius]OIW21759.1 hypothetical protein TanjilG_09181 [Lupinus angustifolius]